MKEYLDLDKNYQLKTADETLLWDNLIAVPEGAEAYVYWPADQEKRFHKGDLSFFDGAWEELATWNVKDILSGVAGAQILWKREQSNAEPTLNDIAKTAEAHREHNLSNELNDLCAEFGCLPGEDRMAWLHQQLLVVKSMQDSECGAKEPVRLDRESARHRLAMMWRGESTTINGWTVKLDEFGYFNVGQDFKYGAFRHQSLKATLDYILPF